MESCNVEALPDNQQKQIRQIIDSMISLNGGGLMKEKSKAHHQRSYKPSDLDELGAAAEALLDSPKLKENLKAAQQMIQGFARHDMPIECIKDQVKSRVGIAI